MSGARETVPGSSLLRAAERLLSQRALETVVRPALADLQHEAALARDSGRSRRAAVFLRGYAALGRAVAVWCASWPARSLREDWMAADAPGPRFLTAVAPRGAIVMSLLVLAYTRLTPGVQGGVSVHHWLIPSTVAGMTPAAFVLAMVLASGRLRRTSADWTARVYLGAAIGMSVFLAAAMFAFWTWVCLPANQVYRQRAFRAYLEDNSRRGDASLVPPPATAWLEKGSREMTLGELSTRIEAARTAGEPTARLRTEWHTRWAWPASCLLLGPVGLGLQAGVRRRRTALAFAAALSVVFWHYTLVWFVMSPMGANLLPGWLAMWGIDALLALLALALLARREEAPAAA